MSGKVVVGGRSSGKTLNTSTSITEDMMLEITNEVAAALGSSSSGNVISDVTEYTITAAAGTNVFTTLTHNIGATNYLVQVADNSGDNIIIPFTRASNTVVFYFGQVSVDTDYTVLISGGNTTSITNAITDAAIEAIAANSSLLPEIKSYTITANTGTGVFETLTHNLGVTNSDYIVQIIDSNKNNIIVPFTRNANDVIFYFGEVTVQETYKVIIVH